MTVTEPEVAVEANGAQPPTNAVEGDGIDYNDDGTVRFHVDGVTYTLRTPRIGQFKALHQHWVSLGDLPLNEQLDGQIGWVKHLFNGDDKWPGLSDKKLTEDEDGWPSWLGVATQYQLKVMGHFRDVPLARGGQAPA